MKTMTFDIETIAADESQMEVLKYLYEIKIKKRGKAMLKEDGTLKSFVEFFRETSLDGAFGRVLCIVYAINDEPVRLIYNENNEKKTLEDFWDACIGIDTFVGHNVIDFDFKFIHQRSVVLGVKPTRDLNFARYRKHPIYDTMKEWSKYSNDEKRTLEHIALALGLPTPKDGIDGSQVYDFYLAGKAKEICEYCKRDVETTREIYKRMNFSD